VARLLSLFHSDFGATRRVQEAGDVMGISHPPARIGADEEDVTHLAPRGDDTFPVVVDTRTRQGVPTVCDVVGLHTIDFVAKNVDP
jgi:hypothetical protein